MQLFFTLRYISVSFLYSNRPQMKRNLIGIKFCFRIYIPVKQMKLSLIGSIRNGVLFQKGGIRVNVAGTLLQLIHVVFAMCSTLKNV